MTRADTTSRQGNALPGRLAENVMHFARVLRDAGLPVGTDRVLLAYDALRAGGIECARISMRCSPPASSAAASTARCSNQAFHIFWKTATCFGKIMQLLMPQMKQKADASAAAGEPPAGRRDVQGHCAKPPEPTDSQRIEIDAALSWDRREQLRKADFDTMSAAEMGGREALAWSAWICSSRDCRHGAMRRRYVVTGSTCARCCGPRRGRVGTSRVSPTAAAALVPSPWSRW